MEHRRSPKNSPAAPSASASPRHPPIALDSPFSSDSFPAPNAFKHDDLRPAAPPTPYRYGPFPSAFPIGMPGSAHGLLPYGLDHPHSPPADSASDTTPGTASHTAAHAAAAGTAPPDPYPVGLVAPHYKARLPYQHTPATPQADFSMPLDPMHFHPMADSLLQPPRMAPAYSPSPLHDPLHLLHSAAYAKNDPPAPEPLKRPSSRSSDGSAKKSRLEFAEDADFQIKSIASKAFALPLDDLALKVKSVERNDPLPEGSLFACLNSSKASKIDKARQIYALAWANQHCEASHTAVVPRNRIYARYVQSCADANLTPVLAATFGRHVRILFPNLKTRRLGMRGKSKYHYCGLKLISDQSQESSPASNYSSVDADSPQSYGIQTPSHTDSPMFNPVPMTPSSSTQIPELFHMNELKYLPELDSLIKRTMVNDTTHHALDLPSLYSYLPKYHDMDSDVVDTLHSMYRVYCTSILESMRYMHVEKMFSSITIVPATFTPSVFNLLKSDMASNWVRDCDLKLYRSMLKMLTGLNLHSVPAEIRGPLCRIAKGFVSQMSLSLEKFPKPFVAMKLRLASQFVQLVKRFLRCVDSAVGAKHVLGNAAERAAMSQEWASLDFRDIVMREIPCASEKSALLLDLLEVQVPKCFAGNTGQDVLHQLSKFVLGIPSMFPGINPWLYSLLCSNLLTSCIRELSIAGARSFKSWWAVRCWVDEYTSWNLELGGYFYEEYRRHYELEALQEQTASHSTAPEPVHSESRTAFVDLLEEWRGE